MVPDLPFGWQIGAGAVTGVFVVLWGIAQWITRQSRASTPVPPDSPFADVRSLVERHEVDSAQTRAAVEALSRQMAERIDAVDRANATRVQALADNISRVQREVELENRRQFDRLMDRLDRLGSRD